MLAPLTSHSARALLSPSARVLASSSLPDCGVSVAAELPWHDVHWPTLVALIPYERAESQLFRLLHAAPEGAVPEDVKQAVQSLYRVALFRSAELAEAAAVAINALEGADVQCLWLKGAALAMRSEQEFAVRGMGDIDVLLAPENRVRARAALREAGWMAVDGGGGYATHHHDEPMVWRGGIRLEVHTALFPAGHPFASDDAGVWLQRAERLARGERQLLVLPVEWHLVHASAHWAWSHEGDVGSWQFLHDAQVLTGGWRPGGPEWAGVVDHAMAGGMAAPVGWALWCAARLADAPVPEQVLRVLRGRARLLDSVAEREWVLRVFHSPVASPSVAWSRFWWRRAMRGLGDAGQQWPWALGHGTEPRPSLPEERLSPEGLVASATGIARQSGRWRRHLARVLRT